MKQYCRYCIEFYVGCDSGRGWCEEKQRYYTKATASKPNNCEHFQLVNCEKEYQDAFMEYMSGYIPRSERLREKYDNKSEQLSFIEKEDNNG